MMGITLSKTITLLRRSVPEKGVQEMKNRRPNVRGDRSSLGDLVLKTVAIAVATICPLVSQPPKDQPRELVLLLRPYGFEPREVTRPAGQILLVVNNRSGARAIELHLDVEHGNSVKQVKVPPTKVDYEELYKLTPGTYLLTESHHPTWVCRINVTPN